MILRAIAFHEDISRDKLQELFSSSQNCVFAGTSRAQCPKCHIQFAVFFPSNDDPENETYRTSLEKVIGDDCRVGKHQREYQFSTLPVI